MIRGMIRKWVARRRVIEVRERIKRQRELQGVVQLRDKLPK